MTVEQLRGCHSHQAKLKVGDTVVRNGRTYVVVSNQFNGVRKAPKRQTLPKGTRERVLRRDRGTCRYCGAFDTTMHIDHVVPVIMGGSNKINNLVAACQACNTRKGVQLWKPLPLHVAMGKGRRTHA